MLVNVDAGLFPMSVRKEGEIKEHIPVMRVMRVLHLGRRLMTTGVVVK